MKKIALIADGSDTILNKTSKHGGANTVAYNVFKILKERNYDITIICLYDNTNVVEDNVKIISLGMSHLDYGIQGKLDPLLSDYDKVINFMPYVITDGTVIQAHSYIGRTKSASFLYYPIKRLIYNDKIKRQKRIFEKTFNYAFAVSNGVREDYMKNCCLQNIKVVYPGCKNVYNNFLADMNDILTFGLVANASINKSGHYCILILSIAKLLGLKFKLQIIATKYDKDFLMRFLIEKLGLAKITKVLPKQDDMADFYKSIDCVIMPSARESFGLVPLEAMSFCKTCLVSNTIGFAEIVDKNSAFIFNRSSAFSFIKSLFKVHNLFYKDIDKFNEIRKNGFEISKQYTWENFVNQLIN